MSTEAVARIRLEVFPSADLLTQLPAAFDITGSVSVTCLPHHGPARTVAASVNLASLGYHTVPHLAARSITGEAELHSLLLQLQEAGVSELFLVAGDRRTPAGPYSWSGELLEAVNAYSPDFSIGIAGYPEGHPQLSREQLSSSLLTKAPLASSVVTQMCFSAEAITRYLRSIREAGIELPVWVGVPGPVSIRKLVSLGARLGVGRSLKLARGTGMAGALWRGDDFLSYDSGRLIREVHQELAGDPLFAGFHVYTFNDLGRMRGLLDDLRTLQPTAALAPGSTSIPLFPAKI
ncbi:methylenetetrahydrofolate reductase [Arthrobacter sp. KBS0703]|uniref:methylenetetrahydrofolate reductase n=1 Tax=Arthrobacter sp. KBS0703 TaxID=1955698 RepID=UPI00098F98DD|nr:methylenetetrahydrofolate reductase [Arthrobacter sp. KBS0703]TSE16051.1 methylenetetrahydrofolate reductase [Arthrobacter sp. KBS0703]